MNNLAPPDAVDKVHIPLFHLTSTSSSTVNLKQHHMNKASFKRLNQPNINQQMSNLSNTIISLYNIQYSICDFISLKCNTNSGS